LSDGQTSRQRRREKQVEHRSTGDITRAHVAAALAAESGSPKAITEAQMALYSLMQEVAPALTTHLSTDVDGDHGRRATWVRTLQFLLDAQIVPELRSLSIGLQELDRGIVSPDLAPKAGGRQGGLSGSDELLLMSFAIEAADELRKRCVSSDEYRAELKESETQYSTIARYRKAVMAGPAEFHPRPSYVLSWGNEPPEILLQRIVWAIRDARKKPRNNRYVESS
jgi:hypothetical protein